MKFLLKSLIIVLSLGVFGLYGSDKDKKAEAAPKTETVSIDTTSSSPSSSLPNPKEEKKESASTTKKKNKKKKNKPKKLDTEDLIDAVCEGTIEEVTELIKKINIEQQEEETGCTALSFACMTNKLQMVKLLLANNANINTLDKIGNTPLIIAADKGYAEIMKFLLKKGADVNIKNNLDLTALMVAVIKKNYNAVEMLLGHPDIDIHFRNKHGNTAFTCAIPKIRSLLSKAASKKTKDKNNKTDKDNPSLSSSTSSITTSSSSSSPSSSSPKPKEEHPHSKETDTEKKIEIVDRMMQPKITVLKYANDENPDEFKKALNDALTELSKLEKSLANDTQPKIVDLLENYRKQIETLSNQARLTTSSTDSSRSLTSSSLPSALPSSSEKDNKEEEYQVTSPTSSISSSTTSLSSSSPSSSLPKTEEEKKESASTAKNKKKKVNSTLIKELIDAIKADDLETVQEALKNGADINAKDKNGDTILIIACTDENANCKIVELLLKHGANVDGKDDKGNTPLIRISHFLEYTDIIEILLNHGADVHAKNDKALMNACEFGIVDVVKLLLEKKANVNLQDNVGYTPLMSVGYESGLNYSDIVVKLLLDNGADVNIRNIYGNTALITLMQVEEAAEYESDILRTVKLLIDSGLDVNAEDNQNNTALSLAEKYNLTKTVKFLKEAGAKNKKKADKNKTDDAFINALLKNKKEKALTLAKSSKINPKYKDENGDTALIIASKKGYFEIVKILLEKGADINIIGKEGFIAQQWAHIYGHRNITELVKKCANCSLYHENNLKKLNQCTCSKVYCKYIKCAEKFESHKVNCKKHKAKKTPSAPSSLPSSPTKTSVPSTTVEDKIKAEDKEEGKTKKVEATPSSPSSLPSTKATTPSTTVEDKIKVEDKESKELVETETDEDESEEEEWPVVDKKPKKEISEKRKRRILSILIGSTGRTKPNNDDEETAMKQVMDNPEKGIKIRITLNDTRWPASKGWSKMSQVLTINSKRIKIHYVAHKTGYWVGEDWIQYADFKFKD